ncbi:MAG: gamma-glutamyl-gamma-aminobutyrate hydrolase family protein [Proteobacteria bacterium]|nr:gamma-glutamyl-gamma-aminobutyrate hydrolase family protein [Pseudomonadota bacterium]
MNSTNPKKPLILIIPDREETPGGEIFSIKSNYLSAIEKCGGVPILASYCRKNLRELGPSVSGILIAGGDFDIHPRYYGEKPISELGRIKPERTKCEAEVLRWALKMDLPVLGICGGMQLINVVFGGSLYQDLSRQFPGARHHGKKQKGQKRHPILLRKESRLFRITKKRDLMVNSAHHQAVKALGRGVQDSAISPDGVIEAIESVGHSFVLGVQWHPERLMNIPAQKRIFSAFIRAAKKTGMES